jgi:hypothetical protein
MKTKFWSAMAIIGNISILVMLITNKWNNSFIYLLGLFVVCVLNVMVMFNRRNN